MATTWRPTVEFEGAEPTVEPVTLDEAKIHLRDTPDVDDGLVSSLIVAARQWAENRSRRWFVRRTFTATANGFPLGQAPLILPPCPLVSVTAVTYRDANGDVQTLSPSLYVVAKKCKPAELRLPWNVAAWPSHAWNTTECVTVTGVAGYAETSEGVPELVKRAMLLVVGHLYENRESVVVGASVAEVPQGAEYLIDQLWVARTA